MATDWTADRRLDLLVLGPMGEEDVPEASIPPLRDALEALLAEEAMQALLARYGVTTTDVRVPVGQTRGEIVESVLRRLDTADLVVFNLNPKPSRPDRANVFYELGLVHALGIPAILVVSEETEVPFYVQSTTQVRVPAFTPEALQDALREPLRAFVDLEAREGPLVNDRVTQFYGLPIVDISAAVGLATGYYVNFLSRLIEDGGFPAAFPDRFRHVVYVRPTSLESTYGADREALRAALADAGLTLETEKDLELASGARKGKIWFDHVGGVVLDVPRTIYPLRRSPRLYAFLERNQGVKSVTMQRRLEQRQAQIEAVLLDRVETAIRYQVRHDGSRVRASALHFTTVAEAPALVAELLGG